MKIVVILGITAFISAYVVFSNDQFNYEVSAMEEKSNGEIVPIVGAVVGFDDTHITQNYKKTDTDSDGKAIVSFEDSLFKSLFSIGRKTFCIEIEGSKYCTNVTQLSDNSSIPLTVNDEISEVFSKNSIRSCFAKLNKSMASEKIQIGCEAKSDEAKITALKQKLWAYSSAAIQSVGMRSRRKK